MSRCTTSGRLEKINPTDELMEKRLLLRQRHSGYCWTVTRQTPKTCGRSESVRLMTRTSCVLFPPPPTFPPSPPSTGAGIFVTTVVAGSVALVKPFSVASRPFLRDVIFYMAAVFWTFVMLYKGTMTLKEAFGKKKKDNTHTHTQTFYPVSFVWISLFLQSRFNFWRRPYRGGCLHLIFLSSLPLKSLISGSQQFVLFALFS